MDDDVALERVMQRHELPTIFVHGTAAPLDVQYVEEQLRAALLGSHDVHYSVLSIESTADHVRVGIEAGIGVEIVDEQRSGATVRGTGDSCVAAFAERVVLAASAAPRT